MYKKNSVGNFVLLALEKVVDGTVRFDDLIHHHYRYQYGIPELKKSELARVLKRLREKGLIDFIDDEKLIIKLTGQGKDKAVLAKLSLNKEKWDGKWRIVIWDIPEKRRAVRDLLRSKLKSWGFKPWQQSVWVSKKNCTQELRSFISGACQRRLQLAD